MVSPSYGTVWASILAFACILFVLGLLLCIPFVLARLRGVDPRVDRLMDNMASLMGADPPSQHKSDKQPAPKQFLRSLKVTSYARPTDVEAAAVEDCCAICCCEYEAGQPVIQLSCNHMFHKECIMAWLRVDAVCPMCKTNLLPQPQPTPAPDCQCSQHSQHALPAAPAPAAPAAARPAEAAASGAPAAAATTPVRAGSAAAAGPAAAGPHTPLPAWQLHGLGSPMLGAAGVSP